MTLLIEKLYTAWCLLPHPFHKKIVFNLEDIMVIKLFSLLVIWVLCTIPNISNHFYEMLHCLLVLCSYVCCLF